MHKLKTYLPKLLRRYWYLFFLAVITLVAYGQTLNMFYWIDDWGMLFNMIHPDIFPGNFGHPAYRYNTTPFVFLYPFVGLNSQIYFGLGLIQYFIAGVVVFLLTRSMTKSRLIGLCAALLFSSGYIGSYGLYRLSNSYQLIETAIFMVLTVWSIFLYYKSKKIRYYLLSLFFFTATLEFFVLRAQGLLLIVFAVSILFGLLKFNKQSITAFLFYNIPFFIAYYFFYFWDPRITPGGGSASRDAMQSTLKILFSEKHFELLNNLLISITNTIIPEKLTRLFYEYLLRLVPYTSDHIKLAFAVPSFIVGMGVFFYWLKTKRYLLMTALSLIFLFVGTIFVVWSSWQQNALWNPNKIELFTSSLGIAVICLAIWLYFIFKDKERDIAKLLILGPAWVFAVVFGYFIYSPSTNLDSPSRYLIPGFVGTTLIYAAFFYLLPKLVIQKNSGSRIFLVILTLLLSATLIKYTRQEQARIISTISNPSRTEFETLQKEVGAKNIKKDSVFYFETIDDSVLRHDILGGMPHVAVAIAAGFDDGAIIADSYEHLIYLLSTKKGVLENAYTFFATSTSLVSTTQAFRSLLSEITPEQRLTVWRANTKVIENKGIQTQTVFIPNTSGTIGINPILEADTTNPSLVPSELTVKMAVSPLSLESQTFPYFDYSQKFADRTDFSSLEIENFAQKPAVLDESILSILALEKDKFDMRSKAHVVASSSGRSTEEQNVIDGRLDTNWAAEGGNWNGGELPQTLTVDLGAKKQVDTLTWVNHYTAATPTVYTIEYSIDKYTWVKAKEISDKQQLSGGVIVSIDLGDVRARYFKMSIYDTYRGRGYPPAINELWVSRGRVNLDSEVVNKVRECPYCFVSGYVQAKKIWSLISDVSEAKVFWTTDRNENYSQEYNTGFLLNLDGNPHTYKIVLPPQGTHYQKIKIGNFKLPVNVILYDASLRPLTLRELKERNLIRQFAE